MASSAHGVVRSTNNIDIVAVIEVEQADGVVECFKEEFYLDPESIKEAIRSKRSFNLIHLKSLFKVDVFVPAGDPLSQSQIQHRIQLILPGADDVSLPILSPEDVILQKLRWFDLGDRVSERQWADILGVLETQQVANLDVDFLREMADQAGLQDLLEKALDEVG